MDNQVVSEHLKSLLNGREVKAAAFTTYTFEPEFFELEVIPLLLPGNIPFSSDARVKQFQVREALRESCINLEVFYDLPIFRKEGRSSPSMEYRFHGVHHGNSAFHAKLALILVHDSEFGECLLVGVGSNNLTQAGWWDNIECLHWEIVIPAKSSRKFINRLKEDVAWMLGERLLDPIGSTSALNKIQEFLNLCKSSNAANSVAYYGLNEAASGDGFLSFLRQQAKSKWSYSNWTLEIISPFFAEDPKNRNHEFFFGLGVQEIYILLPKDQDDNGLCQRDYFQHISREPNIHWAEWADITKESLGLKNDNFRRLHAKVYHFYNKKQSWVFIGSINFSHKAMKENIEAGYFLKLDKAGPLLQPISKTVADLNFKELEEPPPGSLQEVGDDNIPRIYLSFDWRKKRLTGIADTSEQYQICLLSPEGASAIANWSISEEEKEFNGDTTALQTVLKNGSLVRLSGFNAYSGKPFTSHNVMLMQTGWSHKPLNLPDLAPEQILAIYADMSQDQRQLLLMNAKIRKLVLEGAAGDMTTPTDDFVVEQFFSEYAEIFYAFRRLKSRLTEAKLDENFQVLDYYLSGVGMDSLPTLLERVTTAGTTVNPVTSYLLLLCAQETYQDPKFKNIPLVKQELNKVRKQIKKIKSTNAIKLPLTPPNFKRDFFAWFEQQFFRVYRTKASAL